MKVAVFGLGYVGTATATGLASRGHDVVGVDVDEAKVALIQAGQCPVVEPGLDDLLAEQVAAGRLRATTDVVAALDQADVSLLCVGTPSSPSGATDLAYVTRAVDNIKAALEVARPPASGFHAVVVRSTVPPGTVDGIVTTAFAGPQPQGWTVGTAMCPEFLREGSGVADFFDPPFVVVGTSDPRVARTMVELFSFLDRDVQIVDVSTAEALKYACNAFHATKVSFTNEIARILRFYGADSRSVMEMFCEDRVLNISPTYLRPGFAFGGSCLPKDLRSLLHLARVNAVDAPLLAGVALSNELGVREVVDRIIATNRRSVAMLGLSFKADTDDLRESPYVELVERLLGKGFQVRVYDPIINPSRLVGTNLSYVQQRLPHLASLLVSTADEALLGAEVAVVGSRHPAALEALVRAAPAHVIDLDGRLGAEVELLPGYEGVGW